ncbi:SGNH/GDSL hydrolase family protein [Bacillus sp. FSL K6-3431]|uniref:SGNH/GDSL hydrolase family protein n=1 Tax=Bacillus sp. FSL K6-3431 TaxID=2921500 RepID=UPI0030F95F3F
MLGNLKKIKDSLGNYIFPVTVSKAVYVDETKTLETKLLELNKLYGLKLGIIGDSISVVGYKGNGMEYPKQIADRNNMSLNNLAVSGSMITKSTVSGHTSDHMCERILKLDDDCDVVIVAGGVNDLRNGLPLGTMDSTDNTTFYGALDILCKNMITKFPNKPKVIITPIKYRANNEGLKPYVSAIKEVAIKYAIPVLDSFSTCDLQPDINFINTNYFYQGDGLHPNGAGHVIRAREIENFLLNLV